MARNRANGFEASAKLQNLQGRNFGCFGTISIQEHMLGPWEIAAITLGSVVVTAASSSKGVEDTRVAAEV
jgi:hypothetical protein